VTSVATGSGLTGGPITSTGTIALAAGGVATMHLADGAVTAAKLAQNGCTSGQVLKWSGSAWVCGAAGSGAALNGTMVAAFDFEEATGTTLNDASGLGNAATFSSGLALGSIGFSGNGVNFSGGMASIAAGNTVPDGQQLTVEAWVRPSSDATSAPRVLATKPGVWALRLVGGASYDVELSVTTRAGTTCTATSSGAAIPTNGWTFVRGWYDGLTVSVGLGGANAAVGGTVLQRVRCEASGLAQVPGGVINLGAAALATTPYLGLLDSLRVFNTAMPLQVEPGTSPQAVGAPVNCAQLYARGVRISGNYLISPTGTGTVQAYCDMELAAGGWTMLFNSVGGADTLIFFQIPYAERFGRRGHPSLDSNFYDGSLYQKGTRYLDVIEDRNGHVGIALEATTTGINTTTMAFSSPAMVQGATDFYAAQFAGGWASSDADYDTYGAANCANSYSGVTQHYSACWAYNIGSDGDSPVADGNFGPHAVSTDLTSIGLTNDGSVYSRVRRITRYVKW
jgi:hypothetical protein